MHEKEAPGCRQLRVCVSMLLLGILKYSGAALAAARHKGVSAGYLRWYAPKWASSNLNITLICSTLPGGLTMAGNPVIFREPAWKVTQSKSPARLWTGRGSLLRKAWTRRLFLSKTIEPHGQGLDIVLAHGRNDKGVVPALARRGAGAAVMAGQAALGDDARTVVGPGAAAEETLLVAVLHQAHVKRLRASGHVGDENFRRDARTAMHVAQGDGNGHALLFLDLFGGAGGQQQGGEKTWLNIALPKGRLGDKAYKLLAGAGYSATEDYNDTRRLVVENPDACVRYFLVKPSDVAIYVEHGAADIGIVGKDILTESGADVYELLDTGMGKCRMCVAGPATFADDESRALRVATKFVNIARSHYARRGRDIDIIKLNGSIELAPILGLSDVIVDIVETGTTLKENDLTVIEEFMPISARFIANKASYKFKYAQLTELLNKMKEALAR